MKRFPLVLTAGILATILIAPLAPSAFANIKQPIKPSVLKTPEIEYPIGQHCVVTVDPLASLKPVSTAQSNANPGFITTDTVKGVLTRVDESWMVLQEGTYENWIPRNKILLFRVSL